MLERRARLQGGAVLVDDSGRLLFRLI